MTAEPRPWRRAIGWIALLGEARPTDILSVGVTLLAVAALLPSCAWPPAAIAAVALGLLARYYGFRVALDRRLFAALADGRLELAALDAALRSATGGKVGGAERGIADRCRGARRLVVLHALATVAQLVAIVVAALLR